MMPPIIQRCRPTSGPKLGEHALAYARDGWSVFPAQARGKHPLTRHGVKDATTNVDIVRRWWRSWPGANIALAVPDGFLVVDVDSLETFHQLQGQGVELPATALAKTGCGVHLWYATGEVTVRNGVSIFPGVDVRAASGYVIVPPSRHPLGPFYRWDADFSRSTIAECPEWLLRRVTTMASQTDRSTEKWHRKFTRLRYRGGAE